MVPGNAGQSVDIVDAVGCGYRLPMGTADEAVARTLSAIGQFTV